MERTPTDRSLIAWMLYACVLFNLLACGIAHGQMSGLTLNGLGGQFCSVSASGSGISDLADDPATQAQSDWASTFNCPMCSSITLGIVFFVCLAWLMRSRKVQRRPVETRSKAPPRYSWPSANPRASPLH